MVYCMCEGSYLHMRVERVCPIRCSVHLQIYSKTQYLYRIKDITYKELSLAAASFISLSSQICYWGVHPPPPPPPPLLLSLASLPSLSCFLALNNSYQISQIHAQQEYSTITGFSLLFHAPSQHRRI